MHVVAARALHAFAATASPKLTCRAGLLGPHIKLIAVRLVGCARRREASAAVRELNCSHRGPLRARSGTFRSCRAPAGKDLQITVFCGRDYRASLTHCQK